MYQDFTNFVRSIYKTTDFIPLHEPRFTGNEKKYINDAIDSTYVSSVGEYVNRFEKDFAAYTGAKYAVAVVNGTAALHLSLKVAGVEPGDAVVTQPLTFVATCNAISYCGATPVFVDVDELTLGMSPKSLRAFFEDHCVICKNEVINKKTGTRIKAVVPMHTFGHPCEIAEIAAICTEFGISLIEDCAESLGSFSDEKHTGLWSQAACFSFNGNKVMTTGGGGMVVTSDEETAIKLKHLSTTAKVPHKWEFSHDQIGFNYRMPNLNAALGCAQLESLPQFLESKKNIAEQYRAYCAANSLQFVDSDKRCQSNYWLNALKLEGLEDRQKFLEYTNENGVMTRPIWTLMYKLSMYKDYYRLPCPISEKLADTVVNIPSSVYNS
jgi:perosamine synthetase